MSADTVRRQISERNIVRLYGFQDLLEVLIVRGLMHQGAHPRTIGRLVDHLRDHYEHPLTQVPWAVDGNRIYIHTSARGLATRHQTQIVVWQALDLEPLRNAVERGRMPEGVGRIVRRGQVMGSKPIFAGTRVPVEAVASYQRRNIDYAGDAVKGPGQEAWPSSRARRPSKIFCRPIWPLSAASSRCRWRVGRNSSVVTKKVQDSQIDSKWQSI